MEKHSGHFVDAVRLILLLPVITFKSWGCQGLPFSQPPNSRMAAVVFEVWARALSVMHNGCKGIQDPRKIMPDNLTRALILRQGQLRNRGLTNPPSRAASRPGLLLNSMILSRQNPGSSLWHPQNFLVAEALALKRRRKACCMRGVAAGWTHRPIPRCRL